MVMMVGLAGLLSASFVVAAADGVPAFDMKKTCQGTEVAAVIPGRNLESCVRSEESALEQLKKGWAEFPPTDRTECVGLVRVSGPPSYVELITCLEMKRDAKRIRETSPPAADSGGAADNSRRKKR